MYNQMCIWEKWHIQTYHISHINETLITLHSLNNGRFIYQSEPNYANEFRIESQSSLVISESAGRITRWKSRVGPFNTRRKPKLVSQAWSGSILWWHEPAPRSRLSSSPSFGNRRPVIITQASAAWIGDCWTMSSRSPSSSSEGTGPATLLHGHLVTPRPVFRRRGPHLPHCFSTRSRTTSWRDQSTHPSPILSLPIMPRFTPHLGLSHERWPRRSQHSLHHCTRGYRLGALTYGEPRFVHGYLFLSVSRALYPRFRSAFVCQFHWLDHLGLIGAGIPSFRLPAPTCDWLRRTNETAKGCEGV